MRTELSRRREVTFVEWHGGARWALVLVMEWTWWDIVHAEWRRTVNRASSVMLDTPNRIGCDDRWGGPGEVRGRPRECYHE